MNSASSIWCCPPLCDLTTFVRSIRFHVCESRRRALRSDGRAGVSSDAVSTSHHSVIAPVRALAEQAFSRAAGAPLVPGYSIRLLKDARENYPAWLDAIARATRFIHFESYIIHDDAVGAQFGDALIARARDGIAVRVIYDWMGGFGKTSRRFWKRLRAGGVEVRCYNAPTPASPLGWLSRDHRKMLGVDGTVGFVSGLCVGQAWVGDPARNIAPWRDTGVEVRGPAVRQIEAAFAQMWALMGEPLPDESVAAEATGPAGETALRVVATVPNTAGLFRVGQLVAALARKRLWLTDAYYASTPVYVQALRSAARDGVDVRLLVPNGTDIPLLRPLSQAGYRTLLEAGIRVFEWNGSMRREDRRGGRAVGARGLDQSQPRELARQLRARCARRGRHVRAPDGSDVHRGSDQRHRGRSGRAIQGPAARRAAGSARGGWRRKRWARGRRLAAPQQHRRRGGHQPEEARTRRDADHAW